MFSPAALKEERDSKPRLLCDQIWPWGWPPLNECTLHHAPPEASMQFRAALPRILYHVRHANPKFGPRLLVLTISTSRTAVCIGCSCAAADCPKTARRGILPKYDGRASMAVVLSSIASLPLWAEVDSLRPSLSATYGSRNRMQR